MNAAPTTTALANDAQRGSHWQQRMVPHHGRTHLDLFSGIGGFALAAASAGFQTIGFSEIEPYACKILKHHWPHVPNYGDIRNIQGVRADLVTGGFPCQPYSLAGQRRGASDDRALWPEMLRVIDESKPVWILGENVAGIISMDLDQVLSDLEHLGYSAWAIGVPACALGAEHRR
jgi:DNA (cytosine-5)-methyltransferase 1